MFACGKVYQGKFYIIFHPSLNIVRSLSAEHVEDRQISAQIIRDATTKKLTSGCFRFPPQVAEVCNTETQLECTRLYVIITVMVALCGFRPKIGISRALVIDILWRIVVTKVGTLRIESVSFGPTFQHGTEIIRLQTKFLLSCYFEEK